MQLSIEDLTAADGGAIEEAAELLHAAFSPLGVWTTMAEARHEVIESISAERVSRVARSPRAPSSGGSAPFDNTMAWCGSSILSSSTKHIDVVAWVER